MNLSPAARAHDISRESAARRANRQPVFWQQDEPRLHIARLDPAYALLRTHFPRSWQRLVRVQALMNATTVLDLPPVMLSDRQYLDQAAPLLRAAAQELGTIADEEHNSSARLAADQLSAYADTGRWPHGETSPAHTPGAPWLYVGPAPATLGAPAEELSERDARIPLCLLVAAPHRELEAETDDARTRLDALGRAAAGILGEEVVSLQDEAPAVAVADLLLSGGVTLSSHWDLLPPRPPHPVTIFANVRRHRLRQAYAAVPEPPAEDLDVSLGRSLRRSVGHIAAHHWRRPSFYGSGEPAPGLKAFELHAFEEAYAALISVLAAASAAGTTDPLRGFVAELLPYAALPHQEAADTAAALLVVGGLRQSSSAQRSPLTLHSVTSARPSLEALVRSLYAALWEADAFALAKVRGTYAAGVQYQSRLAAQSPEPPVELGWTFG